MVSRPTQRSTVYPIGTSSCFRNAIRKRLMLRITPSMGPWNRMITIPGLGKRLWCGGTPARGATKGGYVTIGMGNERTTFMPMGTSTAYPGVVPGLISTRTILCAARCPIHRGESVLNLFPGVCRCCKCNLVLASQQPSRQAGPCRFASAPLPAPRG
jgi:hypothetical protein